MNVLTIPARTPEPWEQYDFALTDDERADAAAAQARLERYRNEKHKRGGQ
jgi:hypothetical protein